MPAHGVGSDHNTDLLRNNLFGQKIHFKLCVSLRFYVSSGWKLWPALAKSPGLFFSALLPGSSMIANSYLPPQARLNALTVGLWLEFRLGFHIQLTGSGNCRHVRAEAERKIWKRYILAKLHSKHRETVANTPKEGKKRRVHVNTWELNLCRISIPLKTHSNIIWHPFILIYNCHISYYISADISAVIYQHLDANNKRKI